MAGKVKSTLPPHVLTRVQRILDREARRILEEELARPPAERELLNRAKREAEGEEV